MAEEVEGLREDVINKTLQEVQNAASTSENDRDPCVICLDSISEKAVAFPCKHHSFDFLCLISWLQEKETCPLCKAIVKSVDYELDSQNGPRHYSQFKVNKELRPNTRGLRRRYRQHTWHESSRAHTGADEDGQLARRRAVYTNRLYSLHVGSNRISQYREFTPQTFSHNDQLVTRAKMWIRRELQVFEFLNPDSPPSCTTQRRANNAEFLLEYIVAILKTVDIKGSKGQAEALIAEYIGKDFTRLFLHELRAWLRSPYGRLEDWDRAVQYDERAII